jgi:hypothetical protein
MEPEPQIDVILPTMKITQSQHQKFTQALEKHATTMTGNEWYLIASELQWTIEDAKTYAFHYFHQLSQEVQHSPLHRPIISPRDEFRIGNVDGDKLVIDQVDGYLDAEWTYEECALFDNLLLRYSDDDDDNDDSNNAGHAVTDSDINTDNADMMTGSGDKEILEMNGRWRKIASMMPNKSARACKERYEWYQNTVKNGDAT